MRKLFFRLFMIGFLMLPFVVHADTDKFELSCSPSSVDPGGTFTCELSIVPSQPYAALEIPFTLSQGVSVTSYVTNDEFSLWSKPVTEHVIECIADSDTPYEGRKTIGTLTLKVADNFTGTTGSITVSGALVGDGNSYREQTIPSVTGSVTVNQSAPPVATGLKTLAVSGGVLSPQFSSTSYGYTLILSSADTASFSLEATPNNNSDTISYTDSDTGETLNPSNITYKTQSGKSSMSISVKVGSGDNLKTYTIVVSKPVSGSPYLSSLTVGGKNLSLKNDGAQTEEIGVSLTSVSSYQVKAVLANSSDYTISSNLSGCSTNGGTLTCNTSGKRSFSVTVTSKSNSSTSRTYIVNVSQGNSSGSGGSSSSNITNNPKTGTAIAWLIGVVLGISFVASIYIYSKKVK